MDLSNDIHYRRSLFRCPMCGNVVGLSEDGRLNVFSSSAFHRHIKNCRKHPRVTIDKEDERE